MPSRHNENAGRTSVFTFVRHFGARRSLNFYRQGTMIQIKPALGRP